MSSQKQKGDSGALHYENICLREYTVLVQFRYGCLASSILAGILEIYNESLLKEQWH